MHRPGDTVNNFLDCVEVDMDTKYGITECLDGFLAVPINAAKFSVQDKVNEGHDDLRQFDVLVGGVRLEIREDRAATGVPARELGRPGL